MSRKPSDLGAALNKLALEVTNKALGPDVALDIKLDALKIASAHHIATVRAKAKEEDDEEGSDFSSFKAKIAAAENNVTPIKGTK